MKRYFLMLILFCCVQAKAQYTNLVWSDEFDGTTINKTNWVFETGNNNGWGNAEQEYYTNRPVNANQRCLKYYPLPLPSERELS